MSADRAISIESLPALRTGGSDLAAPAEQPQVNIVKLVHRNLRGRYVLAGTLAAIFGLAGAAAGYFIPVPKYRAEGWLDVRSTIVQASSDQTSIMPMFTNFVNKQARLLQDERTLQRAMNSEEWRSLGRPTGPDALLDFRSSLSVSISREAQDLILVSFTDPRADAALHGLRQSVIAYQAIYGDQSNEKAKAAQSQVLREQITKLTEAKRAILKDIELSKKEFASNFDTDDFLQLSERLSRQFLDLKDQLAKMRISLLERGVDPEKAPPPALEPVGGAAGAQVFKTAEEIAPFDRDIAQRLDARDRAEQLVKTLAAKGKLREHPERIRAEIELEELRRDLDARVNAWNANPKAAQAVAIAPVQTVAELHAAYIRMSDLAKTLGATSSQVNTARSKIVTLQGQLREAETELDMVTSRIDKMTLDSAVEQRIGRVEANIPEKGDVPTILNADPRKKFAALGLIAGAGLPVGLIFLFGLIDRRYRYADQADSDTGAQLLGILPDLPTNSDDPEVAAAAVHSVHHIRSRLQLGSSNRHVYMVTSPTSGDGKTSLALSLAVSFTASGGTVLLIDFDLIGHGLTTQLGASCRRGVGQKLVDGDLSDLVIPTAVIGLSLVPAGSDDASCASRVSRKAFSDMLAAMRPQYDTIVIDTGPILGSLEANLAASIADAVIVVVRRGQQGSYMQEATTHLRQMGARVAGIVFNRARTTDFNRSTSINASFRSVRPAGEPEPRPAQPADSPGLERLGALAKRVAIDARR